jgi:hypothetical protein
MLRIELSDPATVDETRLRISLDGEEVTPSFALAGGVATWTPPPLLPGEHTLSVYAIDRLENFTLVETRFTVDLAVARFDLRLEPSDPTRVMLGAENDLLVSAVTASGEVVRTFTGVVEITTTDGLAPLHGHVFVFDATDGGVHRVRRLAVFRTLGLVGSSWSAASSALLRSPSRARSPST